MSSPRSLCRRGADHPDATIDADAATLRGLVFGGRQLADARRSGDLRLDGDQRAVARFLRLFPRPDPAPAAGG